jgi:hypothetical protein
VNGIPWQEWECEVIKSHWPDLPTLSGKLKKRTEWAIKTRAQHLGLTKSRNVNTAADRTRIRKLFNEGKTRAEIGRLIGKTERQVNGVFEAMGLRVGKRPPALIGIPIIDDVRQRAYAMGITLAELDYEIKSRGVVGKGTHSIFTKKNMKLKHRNGKAWVYIDWRQVQAAADVLGGTLRIDWEEWK